MDNKLTDSEIVKALKELCDNAFEKLENPIKRKEKIKIWDILCKSLDLINRPYCLYLSPVCKKDYDIACDKFKRRCTNCPLPK